MADLIDRETVRLAYEKSFENDNHKIAGASAIHRQEHRHILHILDKIPTIDPKSLRPQGEWRKAEYKLKVYINCSVCGHLAGFVEQSNYCPNCGAYMKGAGENA